MSSNASEAVWKGDFTGDLKERIIRFSDILTYAEGFAHSASSQLKLKEVAIFKRDQDGKTQCKVTYETTVDENMINLNRTLHGGCAVYFIDVCSSIALTVLGMAMDKPSNFVSQALNTTFHAPAPCGAKIEVVNTTVSFGARTVSAVTEIWDITNRRLCMMGVHNKMAPSQPKL